MAASGAARKRQEVPAPSVRERVLRAAPGPRRKPAAQKPATQKLRALPKRSKAAQRVEEEEVRQHLPLVRQVVQRMLPRKPPEVATEDLVSWGVIGLLDAIRKYDPHREASFSTYAQYRIRGAILDYLRRCDWLPRSVREKTHDIERTTRQLERQLGRTPEPSEVAAELEMSMAEYNQALSSLGAVSMIPLRDLCFGRGEENFVSNEMFRDSVEQSPLGKSLRKERVEILARAIEKLPDKERIVVSFYYFEELTMREMAAALGLTEGRISQLHSQAMIRLRSTLHRLTGEERFL